jgi:A/G-specific adenine glycosylase
MNDSSLEEMEQRSGRAVTNLLLRWFRRHGRNYPWRKKKDPYRVLIAEIMLQRTKADQVMPVYQLFLRKFPDPHTLADAAPEEIDGIFAMLGLKWRAGKVKELAKVLVSQYNGRVPCSREELLSLPGVGEYVANAVLCFAYGMDVAVIDANVCRVIGRVFGVKPRGEARRDSRFRQIAQRLVPPKEARKFNWALIDFAALICTPQNPRCDECPLQELCSFNRAERYK